MTTMPSIEVTIDLTFFNETNLVKRDTSEWTGKSILTKVSATLFLGESQ
jgi:hypothetical protein